jgi:nitric oxide synthase oxygenase domain/subunit
MKKMFITESKSLSELRLSVKKEYSFAPVPKGISEEAKSHFIGSRKCVGRVFKNSRKNRIQNFTMYDSYVRSVMV